jgi:hypothetical protein
MSARSLHDENHRRCHPRWSRKYRTVAMKKRGLIYLAVLASSLSFAKLAQLAPASDSSPSTSAPPSKTGAEAVLQAFHILNNFDIPKGSVRAEQKDAHGNIEADYTLWTSASDLKARRFYFRTYENRQIRSVDLMKMPVDAKNISRISMKGPEIIKSLSP